MWLLAALSGPGVDRSGADAADGGLLDRLSSGETSAVAELYARLPRHLPGSEFPCCGGAAGTRPAGWRSVPVASPIYGWREQLELPAAAGGRDLSIFHSPHWNAPLAVPAPLA